jgi:hypothetical protein
MMLPAVAVPLDVMWPPTPRAQTPPLCWSGCGLAGLLMNADDCVRNAVFVVWMEETNELTEADTPATAAAAVPPHAGSELNPAAVH